MDMKDFSKYLKYRSFDEALHHARRISSERTSDNESLIKVFRKNRIRQRRRRHEYRFLPQDLNDFNLKRKIRTAGPVPITGM